MAMKRRNIEEYPTDNDKDILRLLFPNSDFDKVEMEGPELFFRDRAELIVMRFLISYRQKTGYRTIPYDVLYHRILCGIRTAPKCRENTITNHELLKAIRILKPFVI